MHKTVYIIININTNLNTNTNIWNLNITSDSNHYPVLPPYTELASLRCTGNKERQWKQEDRRSLPDVRSSLNSVSLANRLDKTNRIITISEQTRNQRNEI